MLTAKDKQFGHEVTAGRAGYACEKCANGNGSKPVQTQRKKEGYDV